MLYNIKREKNSYYFFFEENGKPCIINYDSHTIIGKSGRTIKTVPKTIPAMFRSRFSGSRSYSQLHRELYDRLISFEDISINNKEKLLNDEYRLSENTYESLLKKENWKPFLKNLNSFLDRYANRGDWGIMLNAYNDFIRQKFIKSLSSFNLCEAFIVALQNSNFEEEEINNFSMCLDYPIFKQEIKNVNKMFLTSYNNSSYFSHGLLEGLRTMMRDLVKIVSLLKKYNIEDQYTIKNIRTSFTDIQNVVSEYSAKFFKNNQTAKEYCFSNNEFNIFVPTTRAELNAIGEYFHNCANHYEWDNFLSTGERVLAVVEDTKGTFKVCLDFDIKTLEIIQYLGKNNTNINDENLLKFKNEYQTYLRGLLTEKE